MSAWSLAGLRRGRPRRLARTPGTASSVGTSMRLSWRLAPLSVRPSGVPRAFVRRWRFVPGLPRSVGFGPTSSPPSHVRSVKHWASLSVPRFCGGDRMGCAGWEAGRNGRRLIKLSFAGWLPHDHGSSRGCLGLLSGVDRGSAQGGSRGFPDRGPAPRPAHRLMEGLDAGVRQGRGAPPGRWPRRTRASRARWR